MNSDEDPTPVPAATDAATDAANIVVVADIEGEMEGGPFTSSLISPAEAIVSAPPIDESIIIADEDDDVDDDLDQDQDLDDDHLLRKQQRHARRHHHRDGGLTSVTCDSSDNAASTMFSKSTNNNNNNFFASLSAGFRNMRGKFANTFSHKYSIAEFGGPVDRWNLIYLSFCFLGMCTLLPWNFFISADAYWKYKFRNTTAPDDENDLNDMQEKFQTYLAITAFIPNVFFLFVASLLTRVLSAKTRLITSTIFMGILFAVTAAFVLVDTDAWQNHFFIGTLVSVVLINANSAVMQSGVFGLAGLLPQRFMQGVMHGQAMGGTMAALASIVTLAIGKDAVTFATFGYFVLASLVMLLSAGIALMALRSNYLTYTIERSQSPSLRGGGKSDDGARRKYGVLVNDVDAEEGEGLLGGGGGRGGGSGKDARSSSGESGYGASTVSTKEQMNNIYQLFKKIAPEAFSVYICFAITISVFPGIIVLISPTTSASASESDYVKFFPLVFCFFLFNFGDLIGRTLAGRVQWPRARSPRWALPLVILLRLVFIPAFMFCNVKLASTTERHLWTFFNHDAYFIVFMCLFAISNGYFASLGMMFGPKRVPDSQAEMAGSMMAAFLACGLGTGAGLTYVIIDLL